MLDTGSHGSHKVYMKKSLCVMVKTTSHNDHLTVTLNKGTTLFNYIPSYIVTEKKKHNIIRNVHIRYKMMKRKNLHNEVTTPHNDINI